MPNWCENILTLSHTNPDKMAWVIAGWNEGHFFNNILPMPHNIDEQHDWCTSHWGTKWEADGTEHFQIENGIFHNMSFDTAWAPPVLIYDHLCSLGFTITAYYSESGNGFCGRYDGDNGDDCYDIGGGSEWIRRNIPEDIDDVFSLSERAAEYEDEQEDNEIQESVSSTDTQRSILDLAETSFDIKPSMRPPMNKHYAETGLVDNHVKEIEEGLGLPEGYLNEVYNG